MRERSEAMDCPAVQERLEAYVDGELSAAEAGAVEAHLMGCAACAAEHRLASAVRGELRALPELDAPPAVLRAVLHAAGRSRFRPRVSARRTAWAALAAVLAAAVLGAGLWLGRLRDAAPEAPGADPAAVAQATADPAAVAQATAEARYALAYLTRVSRRAGLELKDELLIERLARPSARSLSRSLSPHLSRIGAEDPAADRNRS